MKSVSHDVQFAEVLTLREEEFLGAFNDAVCWCRGNRVRRSALNDGSDGTRTREFVDPQSIPPVYSPGTISTPAFCPPY
jgi:hypothetical protein